MTDNDRIPIVETYRGVGLHDQQSPERLAVVKREIDRVFAEQAQARLLAIAGNPGWAPEARLFAAAKLTATFEIAADERRARPLLDMAAVHASVPALDSQRWRDPWCYGSLLDPGRGPGHPGPVKREQPLA